jgi:hypothetical protein
MIDFSQYKFRCSGLSNLMVEPRKKTETLSETTKSYLRELWIKETFGRDKGYQTISKYTKKGTMVESDSLDLVETVTGEKYFKNLETLENNWIKGTPDLILDGKIIDIKSSWDLWTFSAVTQDQARKDYFWQLLGYMWLTGKPTSELIYSLVTVPEPLQTDEIYRLSFLLGEDEAEKQRINFTFDDIDPKLRIKQFNFDFNQELADQLKSRVEASRMYMESLTL